MLSKSRLRYGTAIFLENPEGTTFVQKFGPPPEEIPADAPGQKAESSIAKNPDYCNLKTIANILRGKRANVPRDLSAAELAGFEFALITSTDVQWTSSKLEAI